MQTYANSMQHMTYANPYLRHQTRKNIKNGYVITIYGIQRNKNNEASLLKRNRTTLLFESQFIQLSPWLRTTFDPNTPTKNL